MTHVLLDGPLGTELAARGVATPLPGWSAHALDEAPEVVEAIHAAYAEAGATVHTANTFRTKAALFPHDWRRLVARAVRLARAAIPAGQRVAGSIAPLEDCYRPDLSPAERDPRGTLRAHAELAEELAAAGCDLLLVETFPHPGEALLAVEAALGAGLETWVSLTPGYRADLLAPGALARAARACCELGARAALVNCVPAHRAGEYVEALVTELGAAGSPALGAIPVGCYANAGRPDERTGWSSEPGAPERYAELARGWHAAGARVLGGCCGTRPEHVAALRTALGPG